jgi:hypothetical protein
MEVRVGNRHGVAAVRDVKETIIVILVVVTVRREIKMVDPDAVGGLNGDSITSRSEDLADL